MNTITFITLASNRYWLGFASLVESIRQNSKLKHSQYTFLAYSTDSIPQWVLDWASAREENIVFRVGQELNDFVSLSEQKLERLSVSIKKLGLFAIPNQGSDLHAFIDSDMLCLNRLDDIFQFQAFAGVPNTSKYIKTTVGLANEAFINGGFFIFDPQKSSRDALFSIYQSQPEKFTQFGDQDVIKDWIQNGQQVNYMPSKWNCMKGLVVDVDGRTDRDAFNEVKLLHFTGENPWDWNPDIRLSEGRFLELELLWWKYFRDSGIRPPHSVIKHGRSTLAYKRFFQARLNYLKNKAKRVREKFFF